jgi:hypothetical protein
LFFTARVIIRHSPPFLLFDVIRAPEDSATARAESPPIRSKIVHLGNGLRGECYWLINPFVSYKRSNYAVTGGSLTIHSPVNRWALQRPWRDLRFSLFDRSHASIAGVVTDGSGSSRQGSRRRSAKHSAANRAGRNATLLFIPAILNWMSEPCLKFSRPAVPQFC